MYMDSNNAAEYKALLHGLRMAISMGIQRLEVRGNGLTDDSLAPPFGKKNAPARCASLRCKPSAAAG